MLSACSVVWQRREEGTSLWRIGPTLAGAGRTVNLCVCRFHVCLRSRASLCACWPLLHTITHTDAFDRTGNGFSSGRSTAVLNLFRHRSLWSRPKSLFQPQMWATFLELTRNCTTGPSVLLREAGPSSGPANACTTGESSNVLRETASS